MLLDFLFLIAAGTHLQRAAEPHYQMRQAKQVASSLSNKPTIKNDKGYLAVQWERRMLIANVAWKDQKLCYEGVISGHSYAVSFSGT